MRGRPVGGVWTAVCAISLALAGCAHPPPPPPPDPGPPPLALATGAPFDGVYTGPAVLVAARGDCNAGGSADLTVRNNILRYRDTANGTVIGRVAPSGAVDLWRGQVRLVGLLRDDTFEGVVRGGRCDFSYTFRRPHAEIPRGGGR